jgi:hypothetical protein
MIEKLLAAHAAGQLTVYGAHAALGNAKAFAAYLDAMVRLRRNLERWFGARERVHERAQPLPRLGTIPLSPWQSSRYLRIPFASLYSLSYNVNLPMVHPQFWGRRVAGTALFGLAVGCAERRGRRSRAERLRFA